MPHHQALDLGPPASWVARFGLPVGGVLLDSGLDPQADYAHFDALALDPVETFSLAEGLETSHQHSHTNEVKSDPYDQLALWSERPWIDAVGQAISHEAWNHLSDQIDLPLPLIMCALSYELGAEEQGAEPQTTSQVVPRLWAARYRAVYLWCRRREQGFVVGQSVEAVNVLSRRLQAPQRSTSQTSSCTFITPFSKPQPLTLAPLLPQMNWLSYQSAIAQIHEYLKQGDLYQMNLTLPLTTLIRPGVTFETIFTQLREVNAGQFSAFFRFDEDRAVMSLSPERLVCWGASHPSLKRRLIETAPIKGTRPRYADPILDQREAHQLKQSEKDDAEHVMILDLERNDLGQVCETGSVEVILNRELKSYSTVHHLVSVVRGALREDVRLPEILRAVFPGGSVTGAPKRRAIEKIRALEVSARGLYCGALGYLDPRGRGDLNIPIRTAFLDGDRLTYHAGGGIVMDSEAEAEWEEMWVKARGVQRGLGELS